MHILCFVTALQRATSDVLGCSVSSTTLAGCQTSLTQHQILLLLLITQCVCSVRLKARVATVDEALTDCKKQLQAAKLSYDQLLDKQTQLHRCGSFRAVQP
jgi:hypothetical protein